MFGKRGAEVQVPLSGPLRCPQCPSSQWIISGRDDSHWNLHCSNGHQFYGSPGFTIRLDQTNN